MDRQTIISEYFEKATSLVLSSAGIDSIEKQALHLIASEAERFAYALGEHAVRLAEASRRSQCTASDIEAAAMCLNPQGRNQDYSRISVSAEQKKRLRLSVENKGLGELGPVEIHLPQFADDSVEKLIADEEGGIASPLKGIGKRLHCYPDWLQRELEAKQQETVSKGEERGRGGRVSLSQPLVRTGEESGPLSKISSLVLAEEESREILTKKLKVNGNENTRATSPRDKTRSNS